MCGEIEVGRCDVCRKDNVPLQRKYYHYNIKCECHGPTHFELVRHCATCTPKEPRETRIIMKTTSLSLEVPKEGFNVILNGSPTRIYFDDMSYEQIVALLYGVENVSRVYSATYCYGREDNTKILFKGQVIKIRDGMLINVSDTSNA